MTRILPNAYDAMLGLMKSSAPREMMLTWKKFNSPRYSIHSNESYLRTA
jgi:hypothetical protein